MTSLKLSDRWNEPLSELRLPPALCSLSFDECFDDLLAGFTFPLTLTFLDLGNHFKQSLGANAWVPPPQLRSLTLSTSWDASVDHPHMPSTLPHLSIGAKFMRPLADLCSVLPQGL